MGNASRNSFRLIGKGSIRIGNAVSVRGKKARPFWFSKDTEIPFAPARIRNVQRSGKKIRFEVEPEPPDGRAKPGFIAVFAADETDAAAIAALLPKTVTTQFEQEQRELGEFEAVLARTTPRAYVTPALIAINIVVFVAMLAGGVSLLQPDGEAHIEWGSNFGPLTTDRQWWRLLSSMFLHFGLMHLAFNMAGLYDGGVLTERLYGHGRFVILYVTAGLAGGVASLLWHPVVNSAGASGAIFGVYGALLAFVFKPGNRVPRAVIRQLGLSTAAFVLYSLSQGMSREGIDNAAHLGGLAGGFLMGLLLARPVEAERRTGTDARRLGIALLLAAIVLPLLASQVKNVGEAYKREQQYRADLKWFGAEEQRLNAAINQWRGLVGLGTHSDAALADQLERDVVVPWEAVHARLSANVLDEQSKMREHQVLVIEFAKTRAEAHRLMLEAIRTNDLRKNAQIAAKVQASNIILEKLKQLNRAK